MFQKRTSCLCSAILFLTILYFPRFAFSGKYDSEHDLGTLNGTVGVIGGFDAGFSGDSNNKIVSINVNAPPEIHVDTSKCPIGSSLIACRYRTSWCSDTPGIFSTTTTWVYTFNFENQTSTIHFHANIIIPDTGLPGVKCSENPEWKPNPPPPPASSLDLSVGAISIPSAIVEADGKPSISPDVEINVNVRINSSGIKPEESRSTNVTLKYGNQSLSKSISLASLASEAVNVPFVIKFSRDDVGDQTISATVDDSDSLGETNRQNNSLSQIVHVLCNVSDVGPDVPWFYQSQSPWGSQDYANQAPNKMSGLGCLVTSLAMLFKHYGIDLAPDGSPMDPGSVNQGLNMTPLFAELGPQYSSYNGYTPTGAVQANGAVAFARNAYFMKCISKSGNVDTCLDDSKSRVSFKHSSDAFNESSRRLINKELCSGNPVILKVPSISSPNDPAKAHFLLATGMTVDENGNAMYLTNNPATPFGQDEKKYANGEYIKGYRLYRPTYDPSMVFFHLSGNVGMVITDPQGRRSGYNPNTSEEFFEIPGGTYFDAESISDPVVPSIFTPAEVRFEGLEPLSGKYQVQVFAKGNTSYRFTQYSFDETGTINGILDKNGILGVGASTDIYAEHSEFRIPVRSAVLNIRTAKLFDTHYKDMAFVSGAIATVDGRTINSIDKYLQIKIGSFVKSIEKRHFKKIKSGRHTTYTYGSFGKNGLVVSVNAETGEFKLFVGHLNLSQRDTDVTTDMMIQADNVIARGLVTFKSIRKKKTHGQ